MSPLLDAYAHAFFFWLGLVKAWGGFECFKHPELPLPNGRGGDLRSAAFGEATSGDPVPWPSHGARGLLSISKQLSISSSLYTYT